MLIGLVIINKNILEEIDMFKIEEIRSKEKTENTIFDCISQGKLIPGIITSKNSLPSRKRKELKKRKKNEKEKHNERRL